MEPAEIITVLIRNGHQREIVRLRIYGNCWRERNTPEVDAKEVDEEVDKEVDEE